MRGERKETIRESLSRFHNLEHRLEFRFITVNGHCFINGLESNQCGILHGMLREYANTGCLIMGGVDKGMITVCFIDMVKEKVKAIVFCLGADNKKIRKLFFNG